MIQVAGWLDVPEVLEALNADKVGDLLTSLWVIDRLT